MIKGEEWLTQYALPRARDTAIDVGCNVGTWTLPLARLFKRVIAIDCHALAFHEMNAQRKQQGIENVVAFRYAAWDKSDQQLTCTRFTLSEHTTALPEVPAAAGWAAEPLDTFTVKTLALDDIELGPWSVDLIKIDTEGAELHVLAGARGLIEAHQPRLIVECHTAEHRQLVLDWLAALGYALELIEHPLYAPDDPMRKIHCWIVGYGKY